MQKSQTFREAMKARLGIENPKGNHRHSAGCGERQKGPCSRVQLALTRWTMSACRADHPLPLPLAGTGGGVAYNRADYEFYCRSAWTASPMGQISGIDEACWLEEFGNWSVRDTADNRINRLLDREHRSDGLYTQAIRSPCGPCPDADRQSNPDSCAPLDRRAARRSGVRTGARNVQWAVEPADGRMVVIDQ